LAAFSEDSSLALKLMGLLARQIQDLRPQLAKRNFRLARERILRHLALATGSGRRIVTTDDAMMNLANEIGLTHESLARTLTARKRDGAIWHRPRSIVLDCVAAI
jgi:CRP-like cAMP-binding protein